MLKKNILYIAVLILAILITIISYFDKNKQTTDEPPLGGDFSIPVAQGSLNDPKKEIFKLQDYRDKVVVLYFGYASCPDICPTALAIIGNTLKKLPAQIQAQTQPLFISVDPERDKLSALSEYGKYFYPTMISATDSTANINKLVTQYGAFYRINKQNDSAMGDSVYHTSTVYIIDKKGKLVNTINHADIQNDLESTVISLTKGQ